MENVALCGNSAECKSAVQNFDLVRLVSKVLQTENEKGLVATEIYSSFNNFIYHWWLMGFSKGGPIQDNYELIIIQSLFKCLFK